MFIRENEILNLISQSVDPDDSQIEQILKKVCQLKGLDIEESAILLAITDKEQLKKLFQTANYVKNQIYGNRLVLFAPLYVSNHCYNNCLYCGFRRDNKEMNRKLLTIDEVKEQTRVILEQGHKRILMLMGESPGKCSLDYFIEAIHAAYSVKDPKGNSIRRINVEIAPLTDEEFIKLSKVQLGTYTVFQETYHRDTYHEMHPTGQKSDYEFRLYTMDRALANGFHDVGIGALFGLYDYKFEVLSLLAHSKYLDETYGVGPHTISIPRIEPAQNAPASQNIPSEVSDMDIQKIVAVFRCSVPYTGIILSTRENPKMRTKLLDLGVSQISAGSKTSPGGYREPYSDLSSEQQFTLNDTRTSGEIIQSIMENGYLPSFCTGCYRRGRVGKDFMDLAKPGLIKQFCLPNGLLTLQEYLEDYADEKTKKIGEHIIEKQVEEIPGIDRKKKTTEKLDKIRNGERDLYF